MTVQNFMQISQIYSHFEAYQTGKIQDSQVPTNHVPAPGHTLIHASVVHL